MNNCSVQISGGKKLQEALMRIASLKNETISVGIMDRNLAYKAAKIEYGDTETPAQPVFRQTINQQKSKWVDLIGKIAIGRALGNDRSLKEVGQVVADDLKRGFYLCEADEVNEIRDSIRHEVILSAN